MFEKKFTSSIHPPTDATVFAHLAYDLIAISPRHSNKPDFWCWHLMIFLPNSVGIYKKVKGTGSTLIYTVPANTWLTDVVSSVCANISAIQLAFSAFCKLPYIHATHLSSADKPNALKPPIGIEPEILRQLTFIQNVGICISDYRDILKTHIHMAEQCPKFLSFADLMSAVGAFMFHWSLMEQGLTDAITEARERLGKKSAKIKGSFAERLDLWADLVKALPENGETQDIVDEVRVQAIALKDIRNSITHGLCGGNSQPERCEAHIICAVGGFENPSGETVKYSLAQLEDFTQGIDACRRSFIRLRNFNHRITLP